MERKIFLQKLKMALVLLLVVFILNMLRVERSFHVSQIIVSFFQSLNMTLFFFYAYYMVDLRTNLEPEAFKAKKGKIRNIALFGITVTQIGLELSNSETIFSEIHWFKLILRNTGLAVILIFFGNVLSKAIYSNKVKRTIDTH